MIKIKSNWKQKLASIMVFVLLLTNVSIMPVQAEETAGESSATVSENEVNATSDTSGGNEFVLETSSLTAFAQGAKADGDTESAGTDNYFTLIYSAKTKVDSSSKTFDDGYTSGQRVNFGGKVTTEKNAVKFTTSNAATVKVWWVAGGDGREMAILNSAGTTVAVTSEGSTSSTLYISTLEISEAGTYYLGGETNNNYIFKVHVSEEVAAEPIVSTLETSSLTAFAQGAKADGDTESAGTNNYFTLIYSAKTKVDSSSKTFDDGYTSGQRVNFGGKVSTDKNAVKFTTSNAATVKVWWVAGGDGREMAILNSAGTAVAVTSEGSTSSTLYISTLELSEAGTYYLGGETNNNYIFKVEVTETPGGTVKPPRADWSTVANPVITNAVQSATDANKVEVTVNANVGYDGADKITVTLTDASGKEVGKANSSAEKTEHTVTIAPTASGTYTVSVVAIRSGEEDKVGASTTVDFVLPLVAPYISSATNIGGGDVSVEWNAVPEAEKYILTVEGTDISIETTELIAVVRGLTIGQQYTIKVVAVRGNDTSAAGSLVVNVVDEVQRKWSFSAFGQGVDTKKNGYTGNINEGSVTVYSEGGKGKIVPLSTDGLAFYYTAMDPDTENFTLTATVNVDSWTLSNGQEGFGIMAADAVGPNGDSTPFWNNMYQNIATKIEYYHDGEGVTTDTSASKISMKIGLGTIARTGASAAEIADVKAGKASMPDGFVSESYALDTSAAKLGSGTYNMVGNYTGAEPTGTVDNTVTTFRLQIQRNNTGYFLRYLDMNDNVISEKKYYDIERTALTEIDEDNIYVGFFASRYARITVTDVELTTIHPDNDAPAEQREIEYVYPVNTIESATFSNSADYELVYYGNADGQLIITDAAGNQVLNQSYVAQDAEGKGVKAKKSVTLKEGKNEFTITFVPDKNYRPGEYKEMTSYDTVTFKHVVEYKKVVNKYLYVSPEGEATAAGTKDYPMDIYSAIKLAAPGQKIIIKEGTYNLSKTVKVERGINGTADNMIYMIADPEANSRPVFDFGGKCAGMVLAGDYWYFQGFDVTRSADAQKGIQVSGSHNTLDNIRTYKNGNTGIQISRYMGTDEYDQWPSYNTILNCTSYLNADKGYEDADGFAAKLTVADGNVFDGCIAAYNADDGWDLFAKVQSGPIGVVTIKNSLAFKNGYVVDESGNEVNAGNGNGFKMGGDSMPGAHVLRNSIAFANKAKGIDSNSGPNIQAYNCTSFDNESYNVAFYTNTAVNTAYKADGVLSYKVSNTVSESFKFKGTQVQTDVYGITNYYYENGQSANSAGATVTSAWFKNIDTAAAITGITRNADGTINMNGYLELTDVADPNAGARMSGTSSEGVVVPSVKVDTTKADMQAGSSALTSVLEPVVAVVKEKTQCNTAAELADYIVKQSIQIAKSNSVKATEETTSVVEAKVQIKDVTTGQYVEATKDNFPVEGVDILLPYPKGTNKDTNFSIAHLVVLGCNGQIPGTMEDCEYVATKDGLVVHVLSASPFVISWDDGTSVDSGTPDNDDDDDDDDDSNGNTDNTTNQQPSSSQTTTKKPSTSAGKLVASTQKTETTKKDTTKKETVKEEKPATVEKPEEAVKPEQEASKDEIKVDDKTDSSVAVQAATATATGSNVWVIIVVLAVVAVVGVGVGVLVFRKKDGTLE